MSAGTSSSSTSSSSSSPLLLPTSLMGGTPLAQVGAAFDELFVTHPINVGQDISSRAREDIGIPDEKLAANSALTYGETPVLALFAALCKIEQNYGPLSRNATFLDIGSGTGKPVFAAALLRPSMWKACIGVELLEPLWEAAEELRTSTWDGGLPFLVKGVKGTQYRIPSAARATPIEFLCGDICEPGIVEWGSIDIAYACSTCFDESLIHKLEVLAGSKMKEGSFLILSSVEISSDSDAWEVVDTSKSIMSWGAATVFIHRRKARAGDKGAGAGAADVVAGLVSSS